MRKIFFEELRRVIRNPRFLISIMIVVGFLGYGVFRAYKSEWVPGGFSFADLWYFAYVAGYFPYAIPLVAALPFTDSLVVDRSEGYMRYLVIRSHYRHYLWAKYLANSLAALLVILIPLGALFLFASLASPREIYPINIWNPNISGRPYGILFPFFQSTPDLFILTISFLAAITGALYSNLGMSISLWLPNRYLAVGAPVTIYLLADFIASKTHFFGPDWSPVRAVAGSVYIINETIQSFILNPIAVLSTVALLAIVFGRRKRILE